MEKEIELKKTIHTTPMGCEISYSIRNMYGIIFLQMFTNFDPLEHINFAKNYIANIEGIRGINSVEINKQGGIYYFGLNKTHDPAIIAKAIEKEFITYFKTLDKNTIK